MQSRAGGARRGRPASLPGIRPLGGTPPSRAPCDRSTCGRGACCAGAKEATGGAHRRRAAALYRHDDMSCCSDGGPGRCKARHAACRRPDASDLQRRVNTAVPCFACAWGRSAGCRWRGLATRGCAFDGRLACRNAKGCFYLARLYDGVVWHSACPVWAAQLSRLPEAVRDACALRRLSARRRARACSFPKSSARDGEGSRWAWMCAACRATGRKPGRITAGPARAGWASRATILRRCATACTCTCSGR